MPRGYQGDPTKIRILHAGSEMFHVFHLHGGGIRWRFNPVADTTYDYQDTGLNKQPKTQLSPSTRLDSQAFGPGESYNLEIEGGAGGVQQGAGEFLFHCHIAEHYISGMWSFWRVYDTLQPDLAPLPDRAALPEGGELGRADRQDDARRLHRRPDPHQGQHRRLDPAAAAAGRRAAEPTRTPRSGTGASTSRIRPRRSTSARPRTRAPGRTCSVRPTGTRTRPSCATTQVCTRSTGCRPARTAR